MRFHLPRGGGFQPPRPLENEWHGGGIRRYEKTAARMNQTAVFKFS